MRRETAIFLALALGRGQKVKYHLISITKSISKIFLIKLNFVCVLTNERYKTYQTGFTFCRLGHAPGMGHWGCPGVKNLFFSHMVMWHINSTGMTSRTECKPWVKLVTSGLGQISLNFGYHVNFKDFYTKLCVCSHK